jgi:hypothetical protein
MTGQVFRLSASFELPLEDLEAYLEDPDLPPEIESIERTRRNNILLIKAVAAGDGVGKYTPTAQLKASIDEKRVYEEEPPRGKRWNSLDEDEEIPSELVTMANFSGDREAVLQNTALQYEMFRVLTDIAFLDTEGTLTAITALDGSLEPLKIEDGEPVPATVEVVEVPVDNTEEGDGGVDWRENPYISE